MRIGLCSYALGWSFGVEGYPSDEQIQLAEMLTMAARLGYQGVQIADNSTLSTMDKSERAALWEQAEDLGLFVEVGARGLTPDNLAHHIKIASEAKSDILRFVIDGPGFTPGLSQIPSLLRDAARQCGDNGLILAIENHDRFMAKQFVQWMEEVDSPNLGICLDSVNSYGCGEGFRETLDALIPHTVNFHLKDFTIYRQPHMQGFIIDGTPAGEGFLPIKEIHDRLVALGKCKSLIVEHWPSLEDSMEATITKEQEWCERSIRNLNTIPGLLA